MYLVDQVSRGRSPWQQNIDGPQSVFDTLIVEQRFTATQDFNLWPQAHLHTQWPGNGSKGDPTFDNFYRSILPALVSNVESSEKMRDAGTALLDKIGVCFMLSFHFIPLLNINDSLPLYSRIRSRDSMDGR